MECWLRKAIPPPPWPGLSLRRMEWLGVDFSLEDLDSLVCWRQAIGMLC